MWKTKVVEYKYVYVSFCCWTLAIWSQVVQIIGWRYELHACIYYPYAQENDGGRSSSLDKFSELYYTFFPSHV